MPNGLADLVKADAVWSTCGIIRVQVKELKSLKIEVRYTPDDCDYSDADVKAAHASFIGIENRTRRGELIALLHSRVSRAPPTP